MDDIRKDPGHYAVGLTVIELRGAAKTSPKGSCQRAYFVGERCHVAARNDSVCLWADVGHQDFSVVRVA
jgi:hypothetical protein